MNVCSGHLAGPGGRRARLVSLALLAALLWSCGPPRERFRHTFDSPEGLATTFLEALAAGDREALEGLPLSKQEYLLEVYPEMRAYGNIPPDFAWSQLEGRNLYGVSFVLDRQASRAWDLEKIVFRGATAYQTFVVHHEPMLHLRARDSGEREELALFGSILEADGRYALLSMNIDR